MTTPPPVPPPSGPDDPPWHIRTRPVGPAEVTCPACAMEMVIHAVPGDVNICLGCRALLVLEVRWERLGEKSWRSKDPVMRRPTDDEEMRWLSHPRVIAAIKQVADHHAQHGSPHPNITPPDNGRPDNGRPGTPPF